jgi:hypothetical protein
MGAGTPAYMAPERFPRRGFGPASDGPASDGPASDGPASDGRTDALVPEEDDDGSGPSPFERNLALLHQLPKADVFAFGMMLNAMWRCRFPFEGMETDLIVRLITLDGARPGIQIDCPAPLRDLIERAWEEHPSDRPDFADIAARLAEMLDGFDALVSSVDADRRASVARRAAGFHRVRSAGGRAFDVWRRRSGESRRPAAPVMIPMARAVALAVRQRHESRGDGGGASDAQGTEDGGSTTRVEAFPERAGRSITEDGGEVS